MSRFRPGSRLFALLMLGLCASGRCMAAPEEIQVYLDEFAQPGTFGLDLHTNYVLSAEPGSVTRRMLRVTPELSYGINEQWEAAVYWLTSAGSLQGRGAPVMDGAKLRLKWRPRAPQQRYPWYWAANLVVGQLARRFYPDGTSGELKFIGVYQTGPWIVGANLNLDRALRSNPIQPATAEIDTKASYRLGPESDGESDGEGAVRIGLENYFFLGPLRSQGGPSTRTTSNFLVADFALRGWEFNIGVGKATGATPDKWLIKAIIGVPLK